MSALSVIRYAHGPQFKSGTVVKIPTWGIEDGQYVKLGSIDATIVEGFLGSDPCEDMLLVFCNGLMFYMLVSEVAFPEEGTEQ